MGASSSSRLGCCIKISFDCKQRRLISASDSCTCFPGLPLTSSNRFIISSSAAESIYSPSSSPNPTIKNEKNREVRGRERERERNKVGVRDAVAILMEDFSFKPPFFYWVWIVGIIILFSFLFCFEIPSFFFC